jgi:HAD superfamily hydrolase (TIGR01484 family)
MQMRPLTELRPYLADIDGVLTDIDDTLTTGGKLSLEAYGALALLQAAGYKVVPVTGGPASLALHAARLWPVDAVIGESGALAYHLRDDGRPRMALRFWHDDKTRADHLARRERVAARILREVPGCALASDQRFRLCDLAIDCCEDVPALAPHAMAAIRQILQEERFVWRQSSIHLNAWPDAGADTYDKLPMAKRLLRALWGVDLQRDRARWLFVGDAPNDEPMFAFFPLAVGVANIARHLPQMRHKPAYLTQREAGAGFAEVAQLLLASRGAP